jgi:inhibitor of KinA sporulation pathway (predicted exonuclease)
MEFTKSEVAHLDYIILDIEFNGRKFASELPMEVIEIGAVRLNKDLEPVDEFTEFVKPVYFAKLNSFIQKKTGIPQESIDTAYRFPKVIGRFLEWLGRSEQLMLVAWGGEDLKRIVLDTRMHKLDDSFWLNNDYYDLLKGFLRCKGLTNDVSVEAALTDLGLSSDGSAHRALDDARMTADIFRAVYQQLDFSYVTRYKDTFSNSKERRLIKNNIRFFRSQKVPQTWESFLEHVLKDKINGLENPKKREELQACFEAEMAKKPIPKEKRAPQTNEAQPGTADQASPPAGTDHNKPENQP